MGHLNPELLWREISNCIRTLTYMQEVMGVGVLNKRGRGARSFQDKLSALPHPPLSFFLYIGNSCVS